MALFRRTDRSVGRRIATFWEWWVAEGRAQAVASIGGEHKTFAAAIAHRLEPLGGLEWALAEGDSSEHVLVITAGGDPTRRALARRVLLAGPEADATWSYLDTRPPAPDPEAIVLQLPGSPPIDGQRVSVSARLEGTRFDVHVHHPAFADLPADQASMLTLLLLDAALGEVDTELWVGEVSPATVAPLDGFGLYALRAVVRDLKGQHVDEDGRPTWVLLQGESTAGPLVAAARVPLHPLVAPLLDTYVAVVLPYTERSGDGLPRDGSLSRLREFEDRLEGDLGVQGMLVAHQSAAGVRTVHVYVDGSTEAVAIVKRRARTWADGRATVHDLPDAGWDSVQHLRH